MDTKVRTGIRAVVTLAAASTLVVTLGGWATGAPSAAPAELTPAGTSVYFSAAEQVKASEVVASFAAETTQPRLPVDPSSDETKAFNASMGEYISKVPWEAVFSQWDCVLLSTPTTSLVRVPSAKSSDPALLMEFSYLCGNNDAGSPATDHAGVVEPAISEGAVARAVDPWTCGAANSAQACIRRNTPSSENPVEFRGQQTIQASKAMRLAWGETSTLSPCPIVTSTTSNQTTWTSGAWNQATLYANYNAYWSNSTQSSGGTQYARVCRAA